VSSAERRHAPRPTVREDIPKEFDRNSYETPPWLFKALNKQYDFQFDLAASPQNTLCGYKFWAEETDSLKQDWHKMNGYLWVNPPYKPLRPWIEKMQQEAALGAKIVSIVPSSTLNNAYFLNQVPN